MIVGILTKMGKEYIETIDSLKRYFDSDEYKSMQKEIIELVKKCEINQVKYGCSLIFDDKGNVIGRIKNIEKENR